MSTVKIKNMDRLLKKLVEISQVDVKTNMNQATALVHAQAKLLAPDNYGNLKGSIHMEVKQENELVYGRVYTNLEYAPFVEFGTGIKGNGTYPYKLDRINLIYRGTPWVYTPDGGESFYYTEGQVAKPFLYPALYNNKSQIVNILKNGLSEKLNKICSGGK